MTLHRQLGKKTVTFQRGAQTLESSITGRGTRLALPIRLFYERTTCAGVQLRVGDEDTRPRKEGHKRQGSRGGEFMRKKLGKSFAQTGSRKENITKGVHSLDGSFCCKREELGTKRRSTAWGRDLMRDAGKSRCLKRVVWEERSKKEKGKRRGKLIFQKLCQGNVVRGGW